MLGKKKGRAILGVDINSTEIHVVEMRGKWPAPQVLRIGVTPTPAHAMAQGRITEPGVIADALRALLDSQGIKTREVVFGMAAQDVTTRILDIPSVPVEEMGAVIEGEMAHQRVTRNATGAFDFMQLKVSDAETENTPQVLLMAADDMIVESYRQIATKANLRLVALEPALCAMYRLASPQVYSRMSALCLTIGVAESEIAIVDNGHIRLYRRIDIGSDHLLQKGGTQSLENRATASASLNIPVFSLGDFNLPIMDAEPREAILDPAAANSLAVELQRSIDYYRREYPQSTMISHSFVVPNVPALKGIAPWLADPLRIDVTTMHVPTDGVSDPVLRAQLESVDGTGFLIAGGLAMRELIDLPQGIPRFDLLAQRKFDKTEMQARRKLTFSLVASLIMVITGLIFSFFIGMAGNAVEHELGHAKEDLSQLQAQKVSQVDAFEKQRQLMDRLRLDGLPLPVVMDTIAAAVPTNVGLREVGLNKSGAISIAGESTNNQILIRLLEDLKTSHMLESTSLDSFDSNTANGPHSDLVHFQISSQLVGVKHPSAPVSASTANAQK